jgi:uncharacterized DUF497 family protein
MNVNYTLHGLEFEWDSNKAVANLRKHRVSFETASEVFHDPFVTVIDEEYVDDELRETVIGMTVDWRLLRVVYTFRQEVVRVISARLATPAERKQYEEQ